MFIRHKKGFGFVTMKNTEENLADMKHEIDGVNMILDIAKPKEVKGVRYFIPRTRELKEKYSDGLNAKFKKYFEQFGPVEDVFVPNNKSFAFVTVKTVKNLAKMNHEIEGLDFNMEPAIGKKTEREDYQRGGRRGEDRGRGRERDYRRDRRDYPPRDYRPSGGRGRDYPPRREEYADRGYSQKYSPYDGYDDYPPQRYEAPQRRYEAPQRGYEERRYAPEPPRRSEGRRYEAEPRRYEAEPPQRRQNSNPYYGHNLNQPKRHY